MHAWSSGAVVPQQSPLLLRRAIQKRPRMARVADDQATAGSEERGDDRRREGSRPRQRDELLIEQPHKFLLVQAVDEPPHERPQIGCGCRDGGSVSRHVRQQQAADSARGAARSVINISAALGLAEGFAVDPRVQPAHFNAARGELAVAPDFHAGHVLRLGVRSRISLYRGKWRGG